MCFRLFSWLSQRSPYPVLGLGGAVGQHSVSPHSVGSQAAGPEMMVRFMAGSWEILMMFGRS